MSAVLMKPERASASKGFIKTATFNNPQTHSDFYQQVIIAILYRENISSRLVAVLDQVGRTSLSTVFFINTFLNRAANLDILGRSRLYSIKAQIRFSRAQVSYIPLSLKITLFFDPLCFAS